MGQHEQEPTVARTAEDSHADRESRRSEIIQVIEGVVLAVVTIFTAWAGYSAATWSTTSRLDLASASTLRSDANRAFGNAEELRNFDSITFNAWFAAAMLGRQEAMDIAERRFRPEFKVAFDAWMATDPLHNSSAPPGPTFMPQYHQPDQERAEQLDRQADAQAVAGDQAAGVADNYVRISLVLAAVLFLVGIGATWKVRRVRWGLVATGATLLVIAVVLIGLQPAPR